MVNALRIQGNNKSVWANQSDYRFDEFSGYPIKSPGKLNNPWSVVEIGYGSFPVPGESGCFTVDDQVHAIHSSAMGQDYPSCLVAVIIAAYQEIEVNYSAYA